MNPNITMNGPNRLLTGAVVLAIAGAALLCALRVEPSRAAHTEVVEPSRSSAGGDELTLVSDASSPPSEPAAPRTRTMRDFLSEYWGQRWPAVEADLRERGKDLDIAASVAPPPWPEVAELARAEMFHLPPDERAGIKQGLLLGVQPLTVEILMTSFGLDAREASGVNLQESTILVEATDARLNELAERYVDELDAALDTTYRNGWFSHAPFFSVSEGLHRQRGVYAKGGGCRGWALGIVVSAEDFPELVETDKELAALRRERDATLAAWVKENKPR